MSNPLSEYPLSKLTSDQQSFIKTNVPDVNGFENDTYVAQLSVMVNGQEKTDAYGLAGVQKVQLKATTQQEYQDQEQSSWYQFAFVFIRRNAPNAYLVYSPMLQSNLIMGKDSHGVVYFEQWTMDLWDVLGSTDQYKLRINGNDEDYLYWNTGDNTFIMSSSHSSLFRFSDVPTWYMAGVPNELTLLSETDKTTQSLVQLLVTTCKDISKIRIARVRAKNTSGADQRLYVELLCGSARLNTTKQATSDPWNQWYFAFVERDPHSFEMFVLVSFDYGLTVKDKTLQLTPCPPNKWTLFEFVTAGEDKWYWRVKGENLYLSCDPDTGDITLTEDVDKRSTHKFTYNAQYERKQPIEEQRSSNNGCSIF
jgi:hypothetical protein